MHGPSAAAAAVRACPPVCWLLAETPCLMCFFPRPSLQRQPSRQRRQARRHRDMELRPGGPGPGPGGLRATHGNVQSISMGCSMYACPCVRAHGFACRVLCDGRERACSREASRPACASALAWPRRSLPPSCPRNLPSAAASLWTAPKKTGVPAGARAYGVRHGARVSCWGRAALAYLEQQHRRTLHTLDVCV